MDEQTAESVLMGIADEIIWEDTLSTPRHIFGARPGNDENVFFLEEWASLPDRFRVLARTPERRYKCLISCAESLQEAKAACAEHRHENGWPF